jgi:hypothetical protein
LETQGLDRVDMENVGFFGPNGKRRETCTQFKVSKQNSILDLIDHYRIMWKAVFDESCMYGLEGDLSYIFRDPPYNMGSKSQKTK